MKQYRCPYCNFKGETDKLIDHINDEHSEMIPENYTATRLVYNIRNKKDHGTCLMCKKPTEWNESKTRYYSLCNNKKCHDDYVKRFEKNMIKVYEKPRLLDDMEQQEKMLSKRKISGTYTFTDGGEHTYTGSFEKKTLEFLDKVLGVKSKELMVPGPVLEYKDSKGVKRKYIPDIYWIDLNLLIEVKDGGNNPNTREMSEYRDKQYAKEKMITDKGEFNYLRLTNNDFYQLFNILAEIKQANLEGKHTRVVRINEAYNIEVGPVGGMPSLHATSGYLIYHGFNGIDPTSDDDNATESISSNYKCAITNDLKSDKALEKDKDGKLHPVLLKDIFKEEVKVYKYFGTKKKFLEVCQKEKLDNSLYEELSGHKQLTKDQINFDPLFERFSYAKIKNHTDETIATLIEEFHSSVGIPNTSLPIIDNKIAEIAKEKLVPFPSLDIKEDIDGFFAYNKYTKRRTKSVKDINDLDLKESTLEDREAEKWEKESNKTLIGDEYDPEALELKKQKYDSMPKKARREADWESFKIYHMTNQELYDKKHSEQLKQDLKHQLEDNYDGFEPMCEAETYNYDLVNYTWDDVEKAKEWAINSMRYIIIPRDTLEELEYDWIQFKSQIRKLQRESDWKSQEIFGMNNETHYNYLKNKFVKRDIKDHNSDNYDGVSKSIQTQHNNIPDNVVPINTPHEAVAESAAEIMLCERTNKISKLAKIYNLPIIFSDDDVVYNGNAFRDKKVNVVLITGMSGSGKTTLANKICQSTGARLVELDMFAYWADYDDGEMESLGNGNEAIIEYCEKTYRTAENFRQKVGLTDRSAKRYYDEMLKMVEYFIKTSNPSNRFVIEGVQIPVITLLNSSILDKTTTVLVNTSVFTSFIRRLKRDDIPLKDLKRILHKYYAWYLSQNSHRGLLNGYYMNHLNSDVNSTTASETIDEEVQMHTNGLMSNTFETSADSISDLPCFTPEEMDYYGINGGEIGNAFIEAWKQVFRNGIVSESFVQENKKRIQKLGMALTDEEKIKLGWNPVIPFNPENRAKMDLRMKKKINHVIVNEVKEFPIKIGDDYSIYIKRSKSVEFEKLYQDSHELLVQYEKADNIEGIKYELVKMAWIRSSVELSIDDKRANNKLVEVRKLINLRARCINDFKKYLAIILKHDRSYNFTKHYEASPFNDGVYKIDGSIVKLGKSIRNFWWASK